MDFDFTTETITPDVSTILTIGGTGAIELPSGTTGQQPGGAVAGGLRWNTTSTWVEYYTGSTWLQFTTPTTAVTTFSTGTTGFTPSSATSGAITLAGILNIANGGTGVSTTPTNGQLLVGNGTTYTVATLGTGTGISTTSGAGTLQINNTGVTSNVAGTGITVSSATGAITIGTANIPNSSLTNSSITIGSTSISLGGTSTTLSGMTGITFSSGTVTGVANPVAATDVVNLQYLQAFQSGLEWKQEVAAATITNLTATYANGTSGIGATLTNSGTQTAFSVDGYTASSGDRILVKNQTTQLQNGIYTVTTVGTGATNWVLTRAIDDNTSASMNNATTLVTNGTAGANTGWTQTTANPTIGISNIIWVQFTGAGSGVSSFQTSLSGLTPSIVTTGAVTLAGTLGATSGGTGTGTAPTAGQLMVGQTGGTYIPFTVTSGSGISTTTGSGTFQINNTGVTSNVAGTGISVSGATGAVTISNTGVTSITGTTNQITASASTGAITLSTPGTFIAPGSIASTTTITAATGLTVTAGGALVSAGGVTVSTLTANSFLYSGTAGLLTTTAAPTNGQLLIGSTGAAPVAATLAVSGTSTYVTNGAGTITLAGPKFWSEFTTAPSPAPTATAVNSIAIGSGASASIYGALATANGDFSTAGDAQAMRAVMRNITTNNTATELFLDGAAATKRLVLPSNSAWTVYIKVIARRTDAAGSLGSWTYQSLIYQDGTLASTVMSPNNGSKTTIARIGSIAGANDPIISADTTNGSLKILVTGVTGQTYRWVAEVEMVQVTN